MDTDAHGSGFICVHPCSSVVILLSALTRPLITVGSSAWSAEFGVYEPFDAEQGAAANPAFAFGFCHESHVGCYRNAVVMDDSQGCLGDRVKWNVAPLPGSPSAQTRPPCLWTMRCTVARPRPYPANSSARCRRWNTPKSLSLSPMSKPTPLSRTK